MYLDRIEDHRSSLEKATRMELYRFAQANKVAEIVQEMPASLMRVILRQKGLTQIKIPHRVLGVPAQDRVPAPDMPTTSIDADEDLMRQWQGQKAAPPPVTPRAPRPKSKAPPRQRLLARPKSEINKLRDECKRLGIHMGRRDRMDDLRAKIEAHRRENSPSSDQ